MSSDSVNQNDRKPLGELQKDKELNDVTLAPDDGPHLKQHLKTHSGKKSFKCSQCDFSSNRAHNLKTHLITHSGEKSFKCSQCDFSSNRAHNLKTHLITHSGEKSFKCSQCDFSSFRATNLKRHLKTHPGEKSSKCRQKTYYCSQCDFVSKWGSNLNKHVKTHNEHKPYKCNQCDYASTQAYNLRRHQETHDEELEEEEEEVVLSQEDQVVRFAQMPFTNFVGAILTRFPPKHVPQEEWAPKMDGWMEWRKRKLLMFMMKLYHPDKMSPEDKLKYGIEHHNICELITKVLTEMK